MTYIVFGGLVVLGIIGFTFAFHIEEKANQSRQSRHEGFSHPPDESGGSL